MFLRENMTNNKMLFHNCSEQVFRLKGNLKEIKQEVLKMLDVWQKESEGNNFATRDEEINKLRKRIENIKTLQEFELVVFEFTCNYETYFKKSGNDLRVATCNNHDWDEIDCIPESSDDYHKIARYNYYRQIFREGNYVIGKKEYEKGKLLFLEMDKNIKFEHDNTFKLCKIKGEFYIATNNELMKVKEITDEDLKNKLGILAFNYLRINKMRKKLKEEKEKDL